LLGQASAVAPSPTSAAAATASPPPSKTSLPNHFHPLLNSY
jgi:hypothetical protein